MVRRDVLLGENRMSLEQNDSTVSDLNNNGGSRLTEEEIMANLQLVNQKIDEKDLKEGSSDGRHEHYLAT